MSSFTAGSTYQQEVFNQMVVKWIIRRHLAFRIIDQPELHDIFKMLYTRVDIPTGVTVARYAHQYFELSKIKVQESLHVSLYSSTIDIIPPSLLSYPAQQIEHDLHIEH